MPNEKVRQENIRNVIRQAMKLFVANGIENTSMEMIARESGLTLRSVQNYFHTKNDLYTAVLKNGYTIELNEIRSYFASEHYMSKSGAEQVIDIISTTLNKAVEYSDIVFCTAQMQHDLRTPLNGVLGFTRFALDETDASKKQYYLEKIETSGKLLLDLVNDTLELSRVESGKAELDMEAVPAVEIVPAIVSALIPEADARGISVRSDFSQLEGKMFWCDKLKMQRIALNLISNSIKYTPAGGRIIISMIQGPSDNLKCRWSLRVEDTGIGMSREFMQYCKGAGSIKAVGISDAFGFDVQASAGERTVR